MTNLDALQLISAYPVPVKTLSDMLERRGLKPTDSFMESNDLSLATADVYMWLSGAPSVKEGDVSFTITNEMRENFRSQANIIYDNLNSPEASDVLTTGYIGENFNG